MKKLLCIPFLFLMLHAEQTPKEGLERASAPEQRDSCELAKKSARENYNLVELNVGCTCERGDNREWNCFVGFTYMPQEK